MSRRLGIVFVALLSFIIAGCGGRDTTPAPRVLAQNSKKTPAPSPSGSITPSATPSAGPTPTPGNGTAISTPGQWPCGPTTPICYQFAPGDSVTVPTTVIGQSSTCNSAQITFVPFFTLPNNVPGWSLTFSPASYTTLQGQCYFATKIDAKFTYAGGGGAEGAGNLTNGTVNGWYYHGIEDYGVNSVATHAPATPAPTPTPGLDIVDYKLGKIVTSTTQSTVAGIGQALGAVSSRANDPVSNCNWTLGNEVASYAANGTAPAMLVTNNVQSIAYYWLGSGDNQPLTSRPVSVTCQNSTGTTLTASTTYQVNMPVVTINPAYNATTGPVQGGVWSNGFLLSNFNAEFAAGDESLVFGNPDPNNVGGVGINWPWTATIPQGGAGSIGLVQIKTSSFTGTTADNRNWIDADNSTGCIDGGVPYAGESTPAPAGATFTWGLQQGVQNNAPSDSPGIDITQTSTQIGSQLNSVEQNGQYTDYFMYQPTNGIWVTLATLTWGHDVTVSFDGAAWSFSAPPTLNHPTNVAFSSALPTWNC